MSTVQEEARERAAQELARQVAPIAAIQDPLAWARTFVTEMTTPNRNGAWRYVQAAPVIAATGDGVPADKYATDLAAVREACAAASDNHHRKDVPNA